LNIDNALRLHKSAFNAVGTDSWGNNYGSIFVTFRGGIFDPGILHRQHDERTNLRTGSHLGAGGQGRLSRSGAQNRCREVPAAPPAPGSAAFEADKNAFEFTRTLKDSERWKLAANDDKLDLDSIASDFSCALSFTLERKSVPHLYALLKKAGADAGGAIGTARSSLRARVR